MLIQTPKGNENNREPPQAEAYVYDFASNRASHRSNRFFRVDPTWNGRETNGRRSADLEKKRGFPQCPD